MDLITEFKESFSIKALIKYSVLGLVYAIILVSNLYGSYMVPNPYRASGVGACYDRPITDRYKGLQDILHVKSVDTHKACEKVANYGFMVCIILFFINFFPSNIRNMKLIFLFTTLYVVGFLVRIIAFSVTVPPPPNQEVVKTVKWYEIKKLFAGSTDASEPVSDFMFSGHAFTVILTLLFLWAYRDSSWINKFSSKATIGILVLISLFGLGSIPCISISGLHYTSDVVIGIVMGILLFLSRYHFIIHLDYAELL